MNTTAKHALMNLSKYIYYADLVRNELMSSYILL